MRKVVLSLLVSFLLLAATSAQMGVVGVTASLGSSVPALPPERGLPSPWPPGPGEEAGGTEARPDMEIAASTTQTYTFGYWRNLSPTTAKLHTISMLPPGLIRKGATCPRPSEAGSCLEGWIMGSDGLILGYANGAWEQISTPTSNDMWGVQAISATLGLAVGRWGTVLTYDWDTVVGDYVWARYPIPAFSEWMRAISAITTTTGARDLVGWAVGDDGALVQGWADEHPIGGRLRYDFTWQQVQPFNPPRDLWDVQTLSPTDAWAVGGERDTPNNGTIIHYDGSNWSVYQDDPSWGHLSGLYMFSEGDEGWVVGSGGIILHYKDGTWSPVASPTTAFLRDVAMVSRTEGWAIGENGLFLHYDGISWQLFPRRLTDAFYMLSMDARSGTVWAVGPDQFWSYGSVIVKYVPGDDAWVAITSPTINDLNEVNVLTENDAWAVGDQDRDGTVDAVYGEDGVGATVLHWNGEYWGRIFQSDPPLPDADLLALDMVSAEDGWAMGEAVGTPSPASAIIYWDGYRWAPPPLQSPINVDINDVSMVSSAFGWAGGAGDRAVVRYDRSQGDYWEGFAACDNYTYDLDGVSLVTDTITHPWGNWYGWAVGRNLDVVGGPYWFIRFGECSGVNRWRWDGDVSCNCNCSEDGSSVLNSVYMLAPDRGWAVGTSSSTRGQIYTYTASLGWAPWNFGSPDGPCCHLSQCAPSGLNDVFALDEPDMAWFVGFWSCDWDMQSAWIVHYDPEMLGYPMKSAYILPQHSFAGVFHEPINAVSMYTSTFGFSVGQFGHIYQYPYPNFLLNLDPDAQAIRPGGVATSTVSAMSIGGISPAITLSVRSAPPPSTEIGFSSLTIEPGVGATMIITTSGITPSGVYTIVVGGEGNFQSGEILMKPAREATFRLYVTDNPIYSVSPGHGPAGTLVTITGEGFGNVAAGQRDTGSNHVTIAGFRLPDDAIESWTDTTITFRPPDDTSVWHDPIRNRTAGPVQGAVVVTADGNDSNDNRTFLLEPYISHLEPNQALPGTQVAICGATFGNDPGYSIRESVHFHVTLGGTLLGKDYVTSWSNNEIIITVPSSPASGYVVVTSNAFDSNAVMLESPHVYLPLVMRNY